MSETPETRYWRTLVQCIELTDTTVGFWVAGRPCDEVIRAPLSSFPESVREVLAIEKRLHVEATTGARLAEEVKFKFDSWELS